MNCGWIAVVELCRSDGEAYVAEMDCGNAHQRRHGLLRNASKVLLLLPCLLKKHRVWSSCRIRLFVLADRPGGGSTKRTPPPGPGLPKGPRPNAYIAVSCSAVSAGNSTCGIHSSLLVESHRNHRNRAGDDVDLMQRELDMCLGPASQDSRIRDAVLRLGAFLYSHLLSATGL